VVKGKKPGQNNIILTLVVAMVFVTAALLAPGCQDVNPGENVTEKEEANDDMKQVENEKMTVPPIDQNVPEELLTVTMAMG